PPRRPPGAHGRNSLVLSGTAVALTAPWHGGTLTVVPITSRSPGSTIVIRRATIRRFPTLTGARPFRARERAILNAAVHRRTGSRSLVGHLTVFDRVLGNLVVIRRTHHEFTVRRPLTLTRALGGAATTRPRRTPVRHLTIIDRVLSRHGSVLGSQCGLCRRPGVTTVRGRASRRSGHGFGIGVERRPDLLRGRQRQRRAEPRRLPLAVLVPSHLLVVRIPFPGAPCSRRRLGGGIGGGIGG
ncbi:hypothetical protein C1J01_48360, partial [Nonomuraea aridisoli]